MCLAKLLTLLLACPCMSWEGHQLSEEGPWVFERRLVDDNSVKYTRTQNVTASNLGGGNHIHKRLGANYLNVGISLQALALVLMLIGIVAKNVNAVNLDAQKREELERTGQEDLAEEEQGWFPAFLGKLVKDNEFAKFIFTLLAFAVLDSLYKAMFIGPNLEIFEVQTACKGLTGAVVDCNFKPDESNPYSVIAATAADALGEGCSKMKIHKPFCTEANAIHLDRIPESNARMCEGDPLVVAEVYFQGRSRTMLAMAFVWGCLLSAVLNFVALIRLFGQGYVVDMLLTVIKPDLQNLQASDGQIAGNLARVYETTTKVEAQDPMTMRIHILTRMAADGLAFGLMMMVLEIEIEDDCVTMRNMITVDKSTKWAYVLMATASVFFTMLTAVALVETVLKVTGCKIGKKDSWASGKKNILMCFSGVFVVMGFVMFILSLLAYTYSVAIGIYLAYNVPKDSAVLLGTASTLLSLFADGSDLWHPVAEPPMCMDARDTEAGQALQGAFAQGESDEEDDE